CEVFVCQSDAVQHRLCGGLCRVLGECLAIFVEFHAFLSIPVRSFPIEGAVPSPCLCMPAEFFCFGSLSMVTGRYSRQWMSSLLLPRRYRRRRQRPPF